PTLILSRSIPFSIRCAVTPASKRSCKRLPARNDEAGQFLLRTEAAQRLQGHDRLRDRFVAADSSCDASFSVFRDSQLGGASCGVAARYRISYRIHSGLGV